MPLLTPGTCRVFYDLETSGRGCARFREARILELAAVADWAEGSAARVAFRARAGEALPEGYFSAVVNGGPSTLGAAQVHRLPPERVAAAPRFEEVWPRFVAFVHAAQERRPGTSALSLVGHNSHCQDDLWLLAELERCGRSVQELCVGGRRLVFEDTYPRGKAGEPLKRALGSTGLGNSEIHRVLHGGGGEAHAALWDAAATRDNWQDERVRAHVGRRAARRQELEWEERKLRAALDAVPDDVSEKGSEIDAANPAAP